MTVWQLGAVHGASESNTVTLRCAALLVPQLIPYRLYRAETQYHGGKHVRDLSKLNRDLSQVRLPVAVPS